MKTSNLMIFSEMVRKSEMARKAFFLVVREFYPGLEISFDDIKVERGNCAWEKANCEARGTFRFLCGGNKHGSVCIDFVRSGRNKKYPSKHRILFNIEDKYRAAK